MTEAEDLDLLRRVIQLESLASDERRQAALDALARLEQALTRAQEEVRSVINRDRTGLAATLNHIQAIVRGWQWIAEGTWGSYTYEEQTTQTLQKEVGELIESVLRAASRGLRQSGDRAIAASRWTLEPLAQAAPAPEKP